MANFSTHIGAGTVVSGALATITLAADVVSPESLVAVTLAGVFGSVLPDIDFEGFARQPRAFLWSGRFYIVRGSLSECEYLLNR